MVFYFPLFFLSRIIPSFLLLIYFKVAYKTMSFITYIVLFDLCTYITPFPYLRCWPPLLNTPSHSFYFTSHVFPYPPSPNLPIHSLSMLIFSKIFPILGGLLLLLILVFSFFVLFFHLTKVRTSGMRKLNSENTSISIFLVNWCRWASAISATPGLVVLGV